MQASGGCSISGYWRKITDGFAWTVWGTIHRIGMRRLWVRERSEYAKSLMGTGQSSEREAGCCAIRRRLAEQFAIAARLYGEAVVLYTGFEGPTADVEYIHLRDAAREAQQRAEVARVLFEEHVDLHRCGQQSNGAAGSH